MFPLEAVKRLRLRSLKRDLPIPYLIQNFGGLVGKGASKGLILQHAELYLILLFSINFSLYCVHVLKTRDLHVYALQTLIVNF